MGNVPSYCKTSENSYIFSKDYNLAICEPTSDLKESDITTGDEFPGTCKFRDSTSKTFIDSKIACTLVADGETRSLIPNTIPTEKVTSEYRLGTPKDPNMNMQEFAIAESMFDSQAAKSALMKEVFDFSSPVADLFWKVNINLENAFMLVFVLGSLLAIGIAIYAIVTYSPKKFYGGAMKLTKSKINILAKK
jgi:hypothetical protein